MTMIAITFQVVVVGDDRVAVLVLGVLIGLVVVASDRRLLVLDA